MRYRFEYKYLVSPYIATLIKSRVKAIMKPDSHSGGSYVVNNLYLDDRYDSFYQAKILGHYRRDKYRLRYYNQDLNFIRLERKHKDGYVSYKETMPVSYEQYINIKEGNFSFMYEEKALLWSKLCVIHKLRGLRPAVCYSYRREAYIYEPGNVRLTFDSPLFELECGGNKKFDQRSITFGNTESNPMVLEVKFSRFLPEIIKRILNGFPLSQVEMSKYNVSREKGVLPYGKI